MKARKKKWPHGAGKDNCGWLTPEVPEEIKTKWWKWPQRGELASGKRTEPPPHGGLTHFACSSLVHISPVMEQTALNSAISSVALSALPVCSQGSQLSLAAHTVLLQLHGLCVLSHVNL